MDANQIVEKMKEALKNKKEDGSLTLYDIDEITYNCLEEIKSDLVKEVSSILEEEKDAKKNLSRLWKTQFSKKI